MRQHCTRSSVVRPRREPRRTGSAFVLPPTRALFETSDATQESRFLEFPRFEVFARFQDFPNLKIGSKFSPNIRERDRLCGKWKPPVRIELAHFFKLKANKLTNKTDKNKKKHQKNNNNKKRPK